MAFACLFLLFGMVRQALPLPDTSDINGKAAEYVESVVCKSKLYDTASLCDDARQFLECIKEENISVAVTGESGAGKSTFINTNCDRKPSDEGAAQVCSGRECTTLAANYTSPAHAKITYTDLPGCGTRRFPCETYSKDFRLYDFDAIIFLVAQNRPIQAYSDLFQHLASLRRPVYLVKNRVHSEVESAQEDYGIPVDQTLEGVRSELEKNYRVVSADGNIQAYAIDARMKHAKMYDFPKLQNDLSSALSTIRLSRVKEEVRKFGILKRDLKVGRVVDLCAGIAAVSDVVLSFIPGSGIVGITVIQIAMMTAIGDLYDVQLSLSDATQIVVLSAPPLLAPVLVKSVVGKIPLLGAPLKGVLAAGVTKMMGAHAIAFLHDGKTKEKIPEKLSLVSKTLIKWLEPFELTYVCLVSKILAQEAQIDKEAVKCFQDARAELDSDHVKCEKDLGKMWYEVGESLPNGRIARRPTCM